MGAVYSRSCGWRRCCSCRPYPHPYPHPYPAAVRFMQPGGRAAEGSAEGGGSAEGDGSAEGGGGGSAEGGAEGGGGGGGDGVGGAEGSFSRLISQVGISQLPPAKRHWRWGLRMIRMTMSSFKSLQTMEKHVAKLVRGRSLKEFPSADDLATERQVCAHVRMHVCMHVCTYVCMHACVHVRMYPSQGVPLG